MNRTQNCIQVENLRARDCSCDAYTVIEPREDQKVVVNVTKGGIEAGAQCS